MPEPAKIRIVLAEDHHLVRDGLRRVLEAERDLEVVGEASTADEACKVARRVKPDIVLLDVSMPGRSGADVLPELSPLVKGGIVFLTAAVSKEVLMRSLDAGLRGLVMKDAQPEVLLKCIRCVAAGEYWVDRNTLADWGSRSMRRRTDMVALTQRERVVVAEAASGFSNKEIASKLHISEDTVKRHLTHVYHKFDITNRVELVLFAIEHNITAA